MSRSSYLFTGIFGSFALSCLALVVVPQVQIGNLQPQVDAEAGDSYPIPIPGKGVRSMPRKAVSTAIPSRSAMKKTASTSNAAGVHAALSRGTTSLTACRSLAPRAWDRI